MLTHCLCRPACMQGGAAGLASQLQGLTCFEAREAALRALSATPAAVLHALGGPEVLACLGTWLREGEQDEQHSFIRQVHVAVSS